MLCAEYADGTIHCGEVEVDRGHERGHEVRDVWLEPDAHILPVVRDAIAEFDAVIIGPGKLLHEPDADACSSMALMRPWDRCTARSSWSPTC